jgi:type IV pilus assembly protein PilB
LRTRLRQDPDIVLVGEIRDYETAEVAVQAALTGHLVLSTLHTNDAPSTVTRLMNMGLEPFLVTASVNTIVAQRLVRKLCTRCKSPSPVPKEQLIKIGFSPQEASKVIPMIGKGCQDCGRSGYKGRVSVYEIMEFTPKLKELVLSGVSSIELKKQAILEGMKTLRTAALGKVSAGITSLEEAVTNTMADN